MHAGEATVVPAVDLRGRLRLYQLTALDAQGERVHCMRCTAENPDTSHRSGWIYDGRLAFIAPADLLSVEIRSGDAAPTPVAGSPDLQALVVQ